MKASAEEIAAFEKLALERGGTVRRHEIASFEGINSQPVKVSEDDFQRAVEELAKRNGWRTFHPRKARTNNGWRTAVSGSGKGWPDLVCLRAGVMIVAELKVAKNKTTAEQDAWLEDFRELAKHCKRIEVFIWRPENWSEIEMVLR